MFSQSFMRTYLGDHPCHLSRYSTFPWNEKEKEIKVVTFTFKAWEGDIRHHSVLNKSMIQTSHRFWKSMLVSLRRQHSVVVKDYAGWERLRPRECYGAWCHKRTSTWVPFKKNRTASFKNAHWMEVGGAMGTTRFVQRAALRRSCLPSCLSVWNEARVHVHVQP